MHQSGRRPIAIGDFIMSRFQTILVSTAVLNGLFSCPLRADTKPSEKTKTTVTSEDVLTDFDSVAASAMKEWNIPGMAVCVVHDGTPTISKEAKHLMESLTIQVSQRIRVFGHSRLFPT